MLQPELVQLTAGFLAAFFTTGLFACSGMIALVKRTRLTGFAVYCVVAGLFCIFAQLLF